MPALSTVDSVDGEPDVVADLADQAAVAGGVGGPGEDHGGHLVGERVGDDRVDLVDAGLGAGLRPGPVTTSTTRARPVGVPTAETSPAVPKPETRLELVVS